MNDRESGGEADKVMSRVKNKLTKKCLLCWSLSHPTAGSHIKLGELWELRGKMAGNK